MHSPKQHWLNVISGEWPTWLEGTMYRVGPGIIQVGDNCYKHPFDMLSVIHKYTLSSDQNKCSYQNKIVDSEVRFYYISIIYTGS